ncbi:class I adenylate-forming enzyme family protein [Chloroflexota bacterium]
MQKAKMTYKLVKLVNPESRTEWVYADRPKNLTELLNTTVKKYGEQEGLIDASTRLSYKQVASSVSNVASALYYNYGIRKGDRVALMLRNGLEFVISFFAIAKIGAISVLLNIALKGEELAFQVRDSGPALLIVEHEFHGLIAEVRSRTRGVKHIFVTGGETPAGTIGFSELLEHGEQAPAEVKMDEMGSAVIMYTSGTTGTPKGAILSHKGIIASAMNVAQLCDLHVGRDKALIVAPLFHVAGLVMALCSSIYTGIPVVLMKAFKAANSLKIIEEEGATAMVAVPTIFWLMLNEPEFGKYNLSSLRFLGAGGSATHEDLLKLCAAKLPGVELAPGYGLTEASGMTHSTLSLDEALSKPGSVGRAVPTVDAKIVDSSGRELPPGETGELLVRGCQVMKEYWNNLQATRETTADGWLHTGDIGKITEDGYTYILDRLKDMIIRSGENIYSIEVENVLYQNPKVLEAAVVGVPDPVFGEQVKAALMLKPGERATPEEIQEFCGKYLANYKVPRYVEFREFLPRNPAGKVIKDELK